MTIILLSDYRKEVFLFSGFIIGSDIEVIHVGEIGKTSKVGKHSNEPLYFSNEIPNPDH